MTAPQAPASFAQPLYVTRPLLPPLDEYRAQLEAEARSDRNETRDGEEPARAVEVLVAELAQRARAHREGRALHSGRAAGRGLVAACYQRESDAVASLAGELAGTDGEWLAFVLADQRFAIAEPVGEHEVRILPEPRRKAVPTAMPATEKITAG